MIISCPECTEPFEVPDDQVADLVQVKCPHCEFGMILDFAAANDPELVEEGMRMASGFRSAADYRASVRPATGPARPASAAEAPEAVAAVVEAGQPAAEIPAPATEAPPLAPAAEIPAPAARVTPPAEAETPAARAAPTPTPAPTDDDDIAVRVPKPAEEVAVHAPDAVDDFGAEEDDELRAVTRVRTTATPVPASRTRPSAKTTRKPSEPEVEIDSTPSGRQPPHTPPEPSSPSLGGGEEESADTEVKPRRKRPPLEAFSDLENDQPKEGMSTIGVIVLVVLLLAALGLVGASLAIDNTPDPRPLLEKYYRHYVK